MGIETIHFTVLGDPVAQSRPRATRFGKGVRLYDSKPIADFKTYFKVCAGQAMNGNAPIDGPLRVILGVYVQKPKSWKKKRIHAATKPDLDNFCKGACDAMEGVIYTNDSRIVELCLGKYLSDTPRCEVTIEALEE
jgi:Holliday junction resolvase RusA-like endonuclease